MFNLSKALGFGTLKPGMPAVGVRVLAPLIVRLDWDSDREGCSCSCSVDDGSGDGSGDASGVEAGWTMVRASFPFRSEPLMDINGRGFDVCLRRV